jgi:hypothetical protein
LEEAQMAVANRRIKHEHSRPDVAKIKRPQQYLKAGTQTDTLEKVPNVVSSERKRNRLARKANDRFLRSSIELIDVYSKLAE